MTSWLSIGVFQFFQLGFQLCELGLHLGDIVLQQNDRRAAHRDRRSTVLHGRVDRGQRRRHAVCQLLHACDGLLHAVNRGFHVIDGLVQIDRLNARQRLAVG